MDVGDVLRLATTFQSGFASDVFRRHAEMIAVPERLDRLPREPFHPSDEIVLLGRVLSAARKHETLLLFSSRGYLKPELAACLMLGLLPRRVRPTLIVYGEMFQPSSSAVGILERRFMSLLKRVVDRFIVFSDGERTAFSQAWGVRLEKIHACRAFVPLVEDEEESAVAPEPGKEREALASLGVADRPYVFAGGSSFRDYAPLIEAARTLPDIPFVIATRNLAAHGDLPPNVHEASLERSAYRALLNGAHAVVVPLQVDVTRASGLFTYLRAMELGKPTIVSNSLGAAEYVAHGRTGWVVDPTPEAYAQTIAHVLDPSSHEEVQRVARSAQASVRELFTLDAYVERLLPLLKDARASSESSRSTA